MSLSGAWEENAARWIHWARSQDHDGFWEGTWPELRRVLPEHCDGPLVEVGCGEGRVGRELMGLGHRVVGVDRSPTLVRAAGHGGLYLVVQADAARLPLPDAVIPVVVACMSLQDVDDLGGTVREIARVLRTGGWLCVAMVHPFASAEDPDSMHTYAPRVSRSYLETRRYEDHMERDGLEMTFVSMHRPLGEYVNACAGEGLLMTALHEFGAKPIPWLLTARFEKVG